MPRRCAGRAAATSSPPAASSSQRAKSCAPASAAAKPRCPRRREADGVPEFDAWASGFPLTLLHVSVALVILAAGATLYAVMTPHREIQLIREGNTAAALSFGGVLVGIALPLAFALAASTSVLEIALWGATTIVVQ